MRRKIHRNESERPSSPRPLAIHAEEGKQYGPQRHVRREVEKLHPEFACPAAIGHNQFDAMLPAQPFGPKPERESGKLPLGCKHGDLIGHAGLQRRLVRLLLRSLAALSGSHEGLDGESDAFGFKVSAEDLDLDDLTGFDGLRRLLDKAVGELADVD